MNLKAQLVNVSTICISVILTIIISSMLEQSNVDQIKKEAMTEKQEIESEETASVIQIIKLKSSLSEDELLDIAKGRADNFRALPGLQQKYYLRLGEAGSYAGVYIWKSKEDMMKFAQSDLAASIKGAYSVEGKPDVEISDILFTLRD